MPTGFLSIHAFTRNTGRFVGQYSEFAEGTAVAALDMSHGPLSAIQMRAIRSQVESFANAAQDFIDDTLFAELDSTVQADLIHIQQEATKALDEIDALAHPDSLWAALDASTKRDVTQSLPIVDSGAVEAIQARLALLLWPAETTPAPEGGLFPLGSGALGDVA